MPVVANGQNAISVFFGDTITFRQHLFESEDDQSLMVR